MRVEAVPRSDASVPSPLASSARGGSPPSSPPAPLPSGRGGTRPRLRRLLRAHPWRLGTGLVLFGFALSHFLNHALGLVSLPVMEAVQEVRSGFWRSAPGTVLLYGSLGVHAVLGVAGTLARRSWRLPPWQLVQVGLGLAIPVLGAAHVVGTRVLAQRLGKDDSYRFVLDGLWPDVAIAQSLFLVAVWTHGVIGLRLWLREKPWYPRLAPLLLALALLVPALATAGWIEAARRLPLEAGEVRASPLPGDGAEWPALATRGAWTGLAALAALLLIRRGLDARGARVSVRYADGRRARLRPGATLLEGSRAAGLAHASACGGRGRCTTCRVLVTEGAEGLPPPNATETAALARIHAPPGVRLACQIRPAAPLAVRLLVPAGEAANAGLDAARWGVERRITVLFADLRGFTALAERLYPYDSVFLLNRYCELMARAVALHGGTVDKFLGDGVMALFGSAPAPAPDAGAADALAAALAMLDALDALNAEFQGTLREPLRMGIGLHAGPVVLGRVGGAALTALGDTVNIASRLESLNKEFGSVLVASCAALEAAGLTLSGAELRDVPVRGREAALRVAVARQRPVLEAAGAGA